MMLWKRRRGLSFGRRKEEGKLGSFYMEDIVMDMFRQLDHSMKLVTKY
jgi:hypothetical protein